MIYKYLTIHCSWLDLWLIINQQNRVVRVTLQPPEGELIELKNHPYRQLVERYLNGELNTLNKLKVYLPTGQFRRAVLEQMCQIPAGQTMSYGELARYAGHPGAARAVGSVCKHNPLPIIIPCHRVIKSNGGLGEYALGIKLKQQLLRHEGVNF